MGIRGLCVAGLDTVGISQKLRSYVVDCIPHYMLETGQSMFAEAHVFYFDEVRDNLNVNHHGLFTDDAKFIGMCGYVTVNDSHNNNDQRILMLLLDEHSTCAYALLLQDTGEDGEVQTTIIKDFLSQSGT